MDFKLPLFFWRQCTDKKAVLQSCISLPYIIVVAHFFSWNITVCIFFFGWICISHFAYHDLPCSRNHWIYSPSLFFIFTWLSHTSSCNYSTFSISVCFAREFLMTFLLFLNQVFLYCNLRRLDFFVVILLIITRTRRIIIFYNHQILGDLLPSPSPSSPSRRQILASSFGFYSYI